MSFKAKTNISRLWTVNHAAFDLIGHLNHFNVDKHCNIG